MTICTVEDTHTIIGAQEQINSANRIPRNRQKNNFRTYLCFNTPSSYHCRLPATLCCDWLLLKPRDMLTPGGHDILQRSSNASRAAPNTGQSAAVTPGAHTPLTTGRPQTHHVPSVLCSPGASPVPSGHVNVVLQLSYSWRGAGVEAAAVAAAAAGGAACDRGTQTPRAAAAGHTTSGPVAADFMTLLRRPSRWRRARNEL